MSRHARHVLDRRALAIGIGLSIAVHAAVFAFVSIDIPAFERSETVVVIGEAPPAPEWIEPVQLVSLLESAPAAAASSSQPTSASLAGAASAPATSAPGGTPAAVAPQPPTEAVNPTIAAAELSYDQLVVLDPMRNAVDPIAFDELPVAKSTQPTEEAVPIYQPGSVGKAKRAWAGQGEAAEGEDRGWTAFIGPGGDGHCPMPSGRPRGGRIPPPIWK